MFALSYAVLWFCLGFISVKGFHGMSAFVRLNGKFWSQVVDLNVRFAIFCWLYCLDQHHTSSTSVKAYQRHRDKHTIIDSTPSTPMREFQKSYSKSFGIFSPRSFVSRQFAVFNVAVWVDLGFVLCSSDGSLLRFCCGHASFCCVISITGHGQKGFANCHRLASSVPDIALLMTHYTHT